MTVNPAFDRRFYSAQRAFGRFGMRMFDPVLMQRPHWHGHIEANFAVDMEMRYQMDGQTVQLPANQLVIFWAGVPHQLTHITRLGPPERAKLCNIYIPLDTFLFMGHIAPLQMGLLAGGMVQVPPDLCDAAMLQRWYSDYRSGEFERAELVKMELNTLLRRAVLGGIPFLHRPSGAEGGERALSSAHMRHVIAMVRHVLENLDRPLRNSDVTQVTGLHENYALSLFSRVMHSPLKQFVIRMRLMRARALLVDSTLPISAVATASGFASISQFYAQFKAGYGMAPAAIRAQVLQPEIR